MPRYVVGGWWGIALIDAYHISRTNMHYIIWIAITCVINKLY